MQLDIGGIVAKCFSCGSKEFASLRPGSAGRNDRLACVRCCSEVAYEDLLSQVARVAIGRTGVRNADARAWQSANRPSLSHFF